MAMLILGFRYQAEMCEGKTRGRLISSEVLFTAVGIVVAYWFDFGMSFVGGPIAWRVPIAMQIVFAIFVIVLVFGLPESPRWLAKHDRWEEAHEVLALVHAKGDRNDTFVQTELQEIRDMVEFERQNSDASYLDLFKPNMIYRTHIGMFTQIWSQLTGMNVMMLYIT